MLEDPNEQKLMQSQTPNEYRQAQDFLKQMEIEIINNSARIMF